ncbi:glycosyltransferase, partial [bacterium]|nr:glycosyltransferase [bacterium]
MYDAINKGIKMASGSIIAYLNCDEQYLPEILKAVKDFFDRHPAAA